MLNHTLTLFAHAENRAQSPSSPVHEGWRSSERPNSARNTIIIVHLESRDLPAWPLHLSCIQLASDSTKDSVYGPIRL